MYRVLQKFIQAKMAGTESDKDGKSNTTVTPTTEATAPVEHDASMADAASASAVVEARGQKRQRCRLNVTSLLPHSV